MISKRERLARVTGNRWSASLLRQLFRTPSLVCLTHHRVADTVDHDPDVISATPAQLLSQVEWLKASFPVLDGEHVVKVIRGDCTLRKPSIGLTFDDGYEDNFAVGQVLMQRFGISAFFFVPTGFIDTGLIPVWDRLGFAVRHTVQPRFVIPGLGGHGPWPVDSTADYISTISRLMAAYSALPPDLQTAFVDSCEAAAGQSAYDGGRRSPFMTWDQIRQLRAMGHVIGAHTHTHPVLASLPLDAQRAEVESSKRILAEHLGASVTVFAYPYGKPNRSFTAATKETVRAAGFSAAFAFAGGFNRPGRIDPYEVKRMKVDLETSISMFRARVSSRGWLPV
jgi:peptidoglycan/xylan/chitin deacetylase (PgdA/CDA1 family)